MNEIEKAESMPMRPDNGSPRMDQGADPNLNLLNWLIDYELHGPRSIKQILMKTKRSSDRCIEMDQGEEYAILMSETDLMGALAAVNRYKSVFSEKIDVRFSIALFPMDGITSNDLLEAAGRRLNAAGMLKWGAVVSSG
jgi:hypothetical protein